MFETEALLTTRRHILVFRHSRLLSQESVVLNPVVFENGF